MKLLHKSIAELIGTFALVFAGCGSIMVASRFPESIPPAAIPAVFGLAVAAMIYAVGHISGAHFNPAVTFAFTLTRHFPIKEAFAYWAMQIVGAFCALFVLNLILPGGENFGATVPSVSPFQAVIWETILTFFLMFVIISVATDTRAVGTMAGAAIGATVMLCAFVGGPVTGASMNPARSLAPAFFEHRLDLMWIYLAGPLTGSAMAAFCYQWIRCGTENQKNVKGCC